MPHSLLRTPVFSIRDSSGPRQVSLSEIMARLSSGGIDSFDGLRSHQQRPWHCFLVQLAAVALGPEGAPPETPEEWASRLLDISQGEDSWQVITPDLSAPAFLQPPLSEKESLEPQYRNDTHHPDDLDVLISSTAHSTKPSRIRHPRMEHWVYALITLQTTQGYIGRGNYGIARMNGGFGNRALLTLSPDLSWARSFQRDLEVLRRQRKEIGEPFDKDGHALLWELPWDGSKESALPLSSLDPHFIEVCRRIRLLDDPTTGEITCWRTSTKGPRVDVPDSLNGRLEDPWTPVNTDEGKAVTIGEAGFKYEQVASIFFEHVHRAPPSLQIHERDLEFDQTFLVARTLVRGQGKTKGLKRRLIPFPDPSRLSENLPLLSSRAEELLEKCNEVSSSLLYPAASQYAFGDEGPGDNDSIAPLISSYSRQVNERFFSLLFSSLEETEEELMATWDTALLKMARSAFTDARQRASLSSARRWRRKAEATDVFESAARRVLPAAFQ